MKKVILLLFFAFILVLGWWITQHSSKEVKIKANEFNSILLEKTTAEKLRKEKDWDSLYIIFPYEDSIYTHIRMSNADKKIIHSNTTLDNICTILFIKDSKLVAFGTIPYSNLVKKYIKKKEYARKEALIHFINQP